MITSSHVSCVCMQEAAEKLSAIGKFYRAYFGGRCPKWGKTGDWGMVRRLMKEEMA